MDTNPNLYQRYENIYYDLDTWGANPLDVTDPNRDLVYFQLPPQQLSNLTNNKPKRIKIQNLLSSIYTIEGYMLEIRIPEIIQSSIYFLDQKSATTDIQCDYMLGKQLPSTINPQIRRKAGGPYDANNITFISNPSLTFTIVYEYW